ncbi:RNA polymerase sigma factor [Knoellia koreensis]|uniref:RNA polymerase sigma factor n=1 Tax=Knoellia koreensis TaxID=2730921 RepID=A0A849H910_9MICO|nr:RNA polymerase sigma factor [Knoellia sp. DB2414S]NNM46226.1 RNA polymerase sigma factor [Knoellia sp. DB2414S]
MTSGVGAVEGRALDGELVRAARLGDRLAFEELLSRHGPGLYRYAVRSTRNVADAQDVVQEAFVGAWRGLDGFDGRSSVRTWLFAILHRKIVDQHRRRPPEDPVAELPDDDPHARPSVGSSPGPFETTSSAELVRALDVALRKLPYRQRACWILVEVDGLTQPEVARVLGMTPDAVRGQLFRGRRALAELMREWQG